MVLPRVKEPDRALPSLKYMFHTVAAGAGRLMAPQSRNVTRSHHLLQTAAQARLHEATQKCSLFYIGQVLQRSDVPESGLVDQLEEAFEQEFGHDSLTETPDDSSCPDAYLMRRPFKAGSLLGLRAA